MMNKTALWVTGDNTGVLGIVLLINRDYTWLGRGKHETNRACPSRQQSPWLSYKQPREQGREVPGGATGDQG